MTAPAESTPDDGDETIEFPGMVGEGEMAPDGGAVETPEESAAIVDRNLRAMGSEGLRPVVSSPAHPYGSVVEQVHRVWTTDQGVDAWVLAEETVRFVRERLAREAESVSSPVQVDGETLTLAWMQRTQPWTQPYSRSFEDSKSGGVSVGGSAPLRSPEQHRPLMHDLMHVTKAVGVLASIAEWADHGSIRTERVDQAEFEGRIADLVMCALHMANNPPKGYETFDLQRAVIERVERVNSVKWASS